MLEIKPVDATAISTLGKLFAADTATKDCWCTWFIVPVREYHAAGEGGNRAKFAELVACTAEPAGLMALIDGVAVGWCAVGPRSRYTRAIRTPTYKGRDRVEDDSVWLVPCFFVRQDARGQGISRALLESAVGTAREHGAIAIEGFPFAGSGRRSSGDVQIGMESLFASCGFTAVRRPTGNRVVMRLELGLISSAG